MAELFVPCDLPEPPRQQSFLRGVMSTLAAATGAISNGCVSEQLAEMDNLCECSFGIFRTVLLGPKVFGEQDEALANNLFLESE